MLRRTKKIFFSALALLVVGFLLLQIQPLTQGHSNPPVLGEPNWDSSETRVLAQRACFDCHSNETKWPWYSYIYPMSNMVGHDVEEGRKYLNFSEWNREGRQQAKTEEMVETISKGQMPLPYYVIFNPEARLTDSEQSRLINGLIATFRQENDELKEENLEEGKTDGEEFPQSPSQ